MKSAASRKDMSAENENINMAVTNTKKAKKRDRFILTAKAKRAIWREIRENEEEGNAHVHLYLIRINESLKEALSRWIAEMASLNNMSK